MKKLCGIRHFISFKIAGDDKLRKGTIITLKQGGITVTEARPKKTTVTHVIQPSQVIAFLGPPKP